MTHTPQQQEQPSRQELLAEVAVLRQEVTKLRQDKEDLEVMLEMTAEHSDTVTDELQQDKEDLEIVLEMTTEHSDAISEELLAAQLRERLRKQEETERIQKAKMESLRQLIAGVAHEINNPIGVISSNDDVSNRTIGKIKEILTGEYHQHKQLVKMLNLLERTNQTSKVASERIAKIVANLRSFVRLDEAEWQIADIHEGLENAIALMEMEPEFKSKIKVIQNYRDIPPIYCSPSSLNQVFISMLKNASEAIEGRGEISIKTFAQQEHIEIEISDSGKGIPAKDINRIFDPGFTTRGVKVGVGVGLSICYQIVVDEHKGRIDVSSELGEGTTFTITLPQYPAAKR